MRRQFSGARLCTALLAGSVLIGAQSIAASFSYDQETLSGAKPWTSEEFQNNPAAFQFVIIGDRTGGANVAGPLPSRSINLTS